MEAGVIEYLYREFFFGGGEGGRSSKTNEFAAITLLLPIGTTVNIVTRAYSNITFQDNRFQIELSR